MLPKQVISYGQLLKEGLTPAQIFNMAANLRLFPTPFKGIYYVPTNVERKAWVVERPMKALSTALEIYLGTKLFYFGGATALEAIGQNWQPTGIVHVVNLKRSGKVDLQKRISRNREKKTYRSGKISRILSFYGKRIVFHKMKKIDMARVKDTGSGRHANKQQALKEEKKFKRKTD